MVSSVSKLARSSRQTGLWVADAAQSLRSSVPTSSAKMRGTSPVGGSVQCGSGPVSSGSKRRGASSSLSNRSGGSSAGPMIVTDSEESSGRTR
jgi:hypothetical protein